MNARLQEPDLVIITGSLIVSFTIVTQKIAGLPLGFWAVKDRYR